MIIYGDKIFLYEKGFNNARIKIKNGKIADIDHAGPGDDVFDATGLYVLPGFIDIHSHGAVGVDFMDADVDGLLKIKRFMAENGVTAFLGATMTMPGDRIRQAINAARRASEIEAPGAEIIGIYMEGPFFCETYKGGQNKDYLKNPDVDWVIETLKQSNGFVKVVCVAPELEGAAELISTVSKSGVTVSAAHTNAGYDCFLSAFNNGLSNVTHLYNAMSPLAHRAPGVVGAAFDTDTTAEIICDGIHVHPAAVRTAVKAKGYDNMLLISDSMRAAGMSDGVYDLGGQRITVSAGEAYTASGNLAGSTSNVLDCFKNVLKWGMDLEGAVKMASENPAKVVCAENKGKIKVGADADFTVLDKDFNLVAAIIAGKIFK